MSKQNNNTTPQEPKPAPSTPSVPYPTAKPDYSSRGGDKGKTRAR